MRNIYKRCLKCGKPFWTATEFFNLCRDCCEKWDNERTLRATKEEMEARRKAYQVKRAIRHGGDKPSKAHKGGWARYGC